MVRAIQQQVDVCYESGFLLFIGLDFLRLYTDTTYSKRVFNHLLLVTPVLLSSLCAQSKRNWR